MSAKGLWMGRIEELQGRFVYPGQPLAVIEEFIPGEGVYVADGTIYAAVTGVVEVDSVSRRISVRPATPKPRVPTKGSIVHGYVANIPRDDLAIVKITHDEKLVPFSDGFTGILHVSQAANRHVNSIYDVVRVGDAVRVQVLTGRNPFIVSIKQASLGVIAAYCSRCGAPLYRVPGQQHLVCLRCGNREQRKVATGYLFVRKG